MNIKTLNIVAAIAAAASATLPSQAATPQVTSVTMTQPGPGRLVKIDYTFTGADAVITLDVQTNAPGGAWASIGGKAVCNATGEVWKKITNDGTTHKIEWRPDLSWPDHVIADGGARAVITAWTLDNTPDYMVVDISASAQQNTQKYYPAVEFLPGGILSNTNYRTGMIVMRKIMAKDVTWMMGSTDLETQRGSAETTHQVTLTNNYYIGVFPVTQAQWSLFSTSRKTPSNFKNAEDRAMRPVEQVSYNEIRNNNALGSALEDASHYWPESPSDTSFLKLLYNRTGIWFDLPSEAQWEFAARAGNGDTKWGDGSGIRNTDRDGNLDRLGRYLNNPSSNSSTSPATTISAEEGGTAVVGSYGQNAWGLYDTAGNVFEWCLDWYAADITGIGGKPNIDTDTPANTLSGRLSGTTTQGTNRVIRGGSWNFVASYSRPACRASNAPTARDKHIGIRLVCTAGLK